MLASFLQGVLRQRILIVVASIGIFLAGLNVVQNLIAA